MSLLSLKRKRISLVPVSVRISQLSLNLWRVVFVSGTNYFETNTPLSNEAAETLHGTKNASTLVPASQETIHISVLPIARAI